MVPLSLRMAAKGGGQEHNSLRSDKCPLSSNASVREPSGTRSPDQCTPDRKLTAVYCRWDARAGRIAEECRWDARGGHIDGSIRCLSMVSFLRNKGCISCI